MVIIIQVYMYMYESYFLSYGHYFLSFGHNLVFCDMPINLFVVMKDSDLSMLKDEH